MAGETVESVVIQGESITVSLLIWRRFRRAMPGMVELLYAVNPGLVLHGPFLPVGTVVRIPIPPPADAVKSVTPVRLWG